MRYLGTSDEVNACDCCGRQDLKSTVAIETAEGHTVYYGVVCASRALKTTAKVVRAETKRVDDEKAEAARRAKRAADQAETTRWFAFLEAATAGKVRDWRGQLDVMGAIETLGGLKAARALYNAV